MLSIFSANLTLHCLFKILNGFTLEFKFSFTKTVPNRSFCLLYIHFAYKVGPRFSTIFPLSIFQ